MSGFRRSHSKVWWANYFQERDNTEDDHEVPPSSLPPSFLRYSQSIEVNNSNRNSSSSPSDGSQKSQDSGFSDSESSSPSSCASKKSDSQSASSGESCKSNSEGHEEETFAFRNVLPRLPDTPINRIPRLIVINAEQNKSASLDELKEIERDQNGNLTKTYLTNYYFPRANSALANQSNFMLATPRNSQQLPHKFSLSSHSNNENYTSYEERLSLNSGQTSRDGHTKNESHRTCFIVDEIPKKTPIQKERLSQKYDNDNESIMDSSISSSNDNTVRYVQKKECQLKEEFIEETKSIPQLSNLRVNKLKNFESRLSASDLSHLPEPTFTSTPKKEDLTDTRELRGKCYENSYTEENLGNNKSTQFVDGPVLRWLLDLQHHYEAECMTTLQAKRIPQYYKKRTSDIIMVSESRSSLQSFQEQTKIIANEFLNLYENISLGMYEFVNSQIEKIVAMVKEFIMNYSQLLPRMESIEKENVLKIMDMCDHFQKIFNPYDQQMLNHKLNLLEKFFSRFVDSVLVQQIILLLSELDNLNSESTLLTALHGIASLNLNSSRTLDLVTRLDGIQKLLTISLQSNSSNVRKASLRSLTIVCQNASSIKQLEKSRGIEIISEILCDIDRSESELSEIVSVLVQITAPWIEDDHIIRGLIYHLYPISNALTRLITTTSSCETLLLCAAAFANISFIEPQAVFILVKLNTADYLLTAVRKLGIRASIFLQEQVATLIANMAAEPDTRPHLAQHRAVGALLCFLQVKHFPLQSDAEIAAAERLQHKSAVALSRLCSNPEIAKQVVQLQGVSRLVRLCREERERNYSDGVLVACLTSLRKITANCGNDSIINLDAKELVEPRLVDSFLMYSSKQESYV